MLEINKPQAPKKTFVLNRTLHVTKDGKVVEEDDVLGVKVLGGAGKAFYEDEAKALGLDDSHRVPVEKPAPPVVEPQPEPNLEPVAEPAPPVEQAEAEPAKPEAAPKKVKKEKP